MTQIVIPNRPGGGDVRSIGAILANFDAIASVANGQLGQDNLADAGITNLADKLAGTQADYMGLNSATTIRRRCATIPGIETRSNTAFDFLTTPDRIPAIAVPTNGILMVKYIALWKRSSATCTAALFIGGSQLKVNDQSQAAGVVQEATHPGNNNQLGWLVTGGIGLFSGTPTVNNGVPVGPYIATRDNSDARDGSRWIEVHGVEGQTVEVGVKFKTTAGDTVTVQNRRLWAYSIGMPT